MDIDDSVTSSFLEADTVASQTQSNAFWYRGGTADINKATQYAEEGRFQIFLLVACLLAFSNVSTFPNILIQHSYAIECDHQLIEEDKKVINDVVYVCLVLGGIAWALMADIMSRKWSLIIVLFVHIISTAGFYCSRTFLWFGVFQGLCSFCRSGIMCITITLISEFQIAICRGSMVCALQLAWVIGLIAFPGLPFSWRYLLMLGEIPAIIAMFAFIFVPDSPRFLLSSKREKEAIRSLQMIHAINTGTNIINFPINRLTDNKTAAAIRKTSVVKPYIPDYMEPRFINIPIVMFSQFVMLFSYSTLSLWFPYLIFRSEALFPVARIANVPQDCKYGLYYMKGDPKYFESLRHVEFLEGDDVENSTIHLRPFGTFQTKPENPCDNEDRHHYDYKSITLNALACMPSLIFLVTKVDTMGRKFFIVLAQVVAGCLAFASYFMHNVGKDLLFSCFFDSAALMSISTSHCLAVELFPTKIRTLGVALIVGAGQCGSILADVGAAMSFGLSCVVVVGLLAISLAISGILMMTIPDTTGIPLR